jgi:sugar/nucleoside kinase (ribokinase family)
MPGGTALYFSSAMRQADLSYLLATSLAETEMHFVNDLRDQHIEVKVVGHSIKTVYFENHYEQDQDHRKQRVLQMADPFRAQDFIGLRAQYFHLGPLLADDIPVNMIKALSSQGKVSLDVQGFLRKVVDQQVIPVDWPDKKEALQYVTVLKANELEMEVLTGSSDVKTAIRILHDWGVKEVVITLGSRGSIIYNGSRFYQIPAYNPLTAVVDATGCGDTYMAGYLYQRIKGEGYRESGEFAAAMATLKIESSGPFKGSMADIQSLLVNSGARAVFGIY